MKIQVLFKMWRFLPVLPGIILAAVIAVPVFLGYNIDFRWYFGSVLAVPAAIWLVTASRGKKRLHLIKRVNAVRKSGKSERLLPRSYQTYFKGALDPGKDLSVDERTCMDLNLDDIFALIDRTISILGANILYSMLRTPLFTIPSIEKRKKMIEDFIKDGKGVTNAAACLGNIFHPGEDDVTDFLLKGTTEPQPSTPLSILGTAAAAASIAALFLIHFSWIILLPLAVFIINMIMYYRHYGPLTRRISALRYIGAMIKTGDTLANQRNFQCIDPELAAALKKSAGKLKFISRLVSRITTFSPNSRDMLSMFFAYLKIFFLIDIHAYRRILSYMEENRNELLNVYKLIGTIDALQAVAAFRKDRDDVTVPILSEKSFQIEAKAMFHPLLPHPVANSFSLTSPGLIITGSNMAGKSTFLRTLGVNVLLSQTLVFCFAGTFQSCLLFPATSIEKHDSVTLGKSLYFDEAKRIFEIMESTGREVRILCIIDELLSGTNSTERRKASFAILNYLAESGSLVLSATHDLQTAGLLEHLYPNAHFADRLDSGGLDFDYHLKPGILSTCNAINLLEQIGYPKEVIKKARAAD